MICFKIFSSVFSVSSAMMAHYSNIFDKKYEITFSIWDFYSKIT
ncbi:hypothetical protein HMPREF1992_01853 [Selenomonas sp. oral taxon 892 str. F0426]|nr:hypothetical protein HMPREF1992_01853 [Selenomonas sp. oral taxon 892 str. F0426]